MEKYVLLQVKFNSKEIKAIKVGGKEELEILRNKLLDKINSRSYSVSYELKIYKVSQ